jgi:hypothetical protein
MVQARQNPLTQLFAQRPVNPREDLEMDPHNALHYTCFILPKDQLIAAGANVPNVVATEEDVLLWVAARAQHIAWKFGQEHEPHVPIFPDGVLVDWRDTRHRRSGNAASAYLVRLRYFHRVSTGPPLHLVRQAILDAIALTVDDGMLVATVLQGGVVQLDDEC